MKPILYYAADCPDTAPFVAELKRLGVDYEAVEVFIFHSKLETMVALT